MKARQHVSALSDPEHLGWLCPVPSCGGHGQAALQARKASVNRMSLNFHLHGHGVDRFRTFRFEAT